MREVAANTNTRAGTVRNTTLSLIPNALSQIAKSHTSTDLDHICGLVQLNTLKRLKINHYTKALVSHLVICR
jgi:hypothetical protein